jgi:hypothetical protein
MARRTCLTGHLWALGHLWLALYVNLILLVFAQTSMSSLACLT